MRAFKGYWLESKNYIDRDKMPDNEVPGKIDGAILLRYDIISKDKEIYTNATTSQKYSYVIECEFKNEIKTRDFVYVDKWRKVQRVEEIVPKDKVNVVRTYPNQYKRVAVRKVYLQ
jgi:hypothetical protein